MNNLVNIIRTALTVFVLMLVVMLLLAGCSNNVKPIKEVVVEYKYKPILLPDNLITDCSVSRPPEKDKYIEASHVLKEDLLTNYVLSLLTDLKNCNVRMKSIRELQNMNLDILKNGTGEHQ